MAVPESRGLSLPAQLLRYGLARVAPAAVPTAPSAAVATPVVAAGRRPVLRPPVGCGFPLGLFDRQHSAADHFAVHAGDGVFRVAYFQGGARENMRDSETARWCLCVCVCGTSSRWGACDCSRSSSKSTNAMPFEIPPGIGRSQRETCPNFSMSSLRSSLVVENESPPTGRGAGGQRQLGVSCLKI